jgi:leucyl aminopeptidase
MAVGARRRLRYDGRMRGSLVIASVLAMAGSAAAGPVYLLTAEEAARPQVFISVGEDAVGTVMDVVRADHASATVRMENSEVAVLQIDAAELEHLSEAMHAQHDRCGGFIVHESLTEAVGAMTAKARPAIDYTIDQGGLVNFLLPEISEARILDTIRELSARKNRYYRSESGAAVASWLRDRWRSYSTRPDVTVSLFDQGYPQKSVILTVPGSIKPDEVIVIGGHLDSIALGGTNANAPGADDDASGIATLDEIARVLLAKDFRPDRTVQFIAYAAEEVGLRGSMAVVREYQRRGVNVVGALQLDMTNYQGSDRDIWLIDDFTSPEQNRFLAQLIETYTTATWGVDRCGYACSDHASWHRAGVPASMPHEARSRDRNRNIHTARDTLEISSGNASHAAKFARLGAAYAIELAKGHVGELDSGDCGEGARARQADAERGSRALEILGLLAAAAAMIGLTRRVA